MDNRHSRSLLPLPHRKSDGSALQGFNPLHPKTSVTLPPELMDKILEYVDVDGRESPNLCACALVATWWTGPSQRRLFSSVKIHRNNYRRWMSGVVLSGSKAHLLGYVRSLQYSRCGDYRMRGLLQDSEEYLLALHNLHILTLEDIRIEYIGREELHTCFSAFHETLTYLSLDNVATSFSAFVTLVDYFPNLTTLRLRFLNVERNEGPVPSLSRPLRGKLELGFDYREAKSPTFVNQFAKLELEYEELVIEYSGSSSRGTETLKRALRISTNTVKFLRVTAEIGPAAAAIIRDFRQLQELELKMGCPSSSHKVPLSSITSTKLRKIIFSETSDNFWRIVGRPADSDWTLVDNQLCELADRLRAMGYRHTLEAELRFLNVIGNPEIRDFTTFLPKFGEKGVVTVINTIQGRRLLHSSIRDR